MKKLVIAVISLLCIAPAAFADNWGLSVHAGIGQNDPKTMKELYAEAGVYDIQRHLSERDFVFGTDLFYEMNLNAEENKLGVKLGIDGYGKNKLTLDEGWEKITETSYAFPLTVYYKRDGGVKNWSFLAGAGITIMRSKIKDNAEGYPEESFSKTKVFPDITVGTEYRFNEVFALGLDVKYNIAAKVKKDEAVLSDRSGFGAALTGRFYF